MQDAFDKYLIDAFNKTRAYRTGMQYPECLDLITKSNGIPVLAHPKSLALSEDELLLLINDMIACGLQGIEVYHYTHSSEDVEYFLKIANRFGLLVSGGSDYHGKVVKPDVNIGTGKDNNLNITDLSVLRKLH